MLLCQQESFRLAMSAYWLLAAAADAEDESREGDGGQASEAPAARDSSGARGSHLEGRAKVAQRYDSLSVYYIYICII